MSVFFLAVVHAEVKSAIGKVFLSRRDLKIFSHPLALLPSGTGLTLFCLLTKRKPQS